MWFEMRDATDPARLPEVEACVFLNDVAEESVIELFLDEPINTPDSTTDVRSPRLVMTLAEAQNLRDQLDRALGPGNDEPLCGCGARHAVHVD